MWKKLLGITAVAVAGVVVEILHMWVTHRYGEQSFQIRILPKFTDF